MGMGMGIGGLTQLASVVAFIMFVCALFEQFCPSDLRRFFRKYTHKFIDLMSPYSQISFFELSGEPLEQSETYTVIQTYLGANSSQRAKVVEDSQTPVVLGIDDNEEITDDFNGVKVWWSANSTIPTAQEFSGRPNSDVMRYLTLTFHKMHGDLITTSYIQHVLEQGKAIAKKNRQLKLYTNKPSPDVSYCSCRYQAFKVLAKNYLDIESHGDLFPIIEKLLGETNTTPADVAENLMPKSITEDNETCLKNLIQCIELAKKKDEEEAKKKIEDEQAQLKAEKEKQELIQEEEKVKVDEKLEEKVKENGVIH